MVERDGVPVFDRVADVCTRRNFRRKSCPLPKIVLGYDSGDSLEQAVAERIAVDAREAGIHVDGAGGVAQDSKTQPDARSSAAAHDNRSLQALSAESFIDRLAGWRRLTDLTLPVAASAEDIYDRERAIVNSYRVVPLVWLPRVYGLSGRVRDWTPPGPGEAWPLADVWLDGPVEAAGEEGKK